MASSNLCIALFLLGILLTDIDIGTASANAGQHRRRHGHGSPPPPPPPPPPLGPCLTTVGPFPPDVPAGSQPWDDGVHLNLTEMSIFFTPTGIRGLLNTYIEPGQDQLSLFQHGACCSNPAEWDEIMVKGAEFAAFRQLAGTYLLPSGLNSFSLVEFLGNRFGPWGASSGDVAFQAPDPTGPRYIVGFFGAANDTHVTQLGAHFRADSC